MDERALTSDGAYLETFMIDAVRKFVRFKNVG